MPMSLKNQCSGICTAYTFFIYLCACCGDLYAQGMCGVREKMIELEELMDSSNRKENQGISFEMV